MGYRSDVKFIINSDKETINKIYDSISTETKKEFSDCLSLEHDKENSYLIFKCNDIKGYTNTFDEVKEMNDLIQKGADYFRDNETKGGIHYVRIGEDGNDTEEIYEGNVIRQINVFRYSELE